MDNLWLLTEERPKPSVILQIIEICIVQISMIESSLRVI